MTDALPPLIAALLEPRRYPSPPASVELIETHASWVLLAGDRAYKIKKPITLPFLDYSTLEQRRQCCAAELRLNRRYAPALYEDVVAITGSPHDPVLAGGGTPIEYAIRMHRFPERARLDHLCARGQLHWQQIGELATHLAALHETAATAPADSRFGEPAQVLRPALDNFAELRRLLRDDDDAQRLALLEEWTRTQYARLQPEFAARKAGARIRECHGDLHLGNMVLLDGRVTLFDSIEFSDDLRWIDVASEIAFAYVDLLDHRATVLAGWLLNEWLAASGDYAATRVLRFYAVYRALVRAKVAAIRAVQRGAAVRPASDYLALAERLCQPPPLHLVITHGVAASGKSRAARRLLLSDRAAATVRVRSDVERKRIFGLLADQRSGSPLDGGIYTRDASEATYQRLLQLAEELLAAGWSVVVDAAFLERARRDVFHALANRLGVGFAIIAPRARLPQLRARIRGRLAKGHDASEADLAVLEGQLARVESLAQEELACLLTPVGGFYTPPASSRE